MKKNINLYKFNELGSTNDYLERNHRNYEEFDVICAKNQTHGRARRQNDWVSMEGMAIFSFFLEERENWEIEDYLKLPLIAGLATIRGLRGIENLEYKFKWTNDVYLENKKLCGILMEKTDNVYIVGIGINVNNILPEKLKNKAISLTQATNKKYKIDYEHVIGGDENSQGKVTGGHSLLHGDVRIVKKIGNPAKNGVYRASIEVKKKDGTWQAKTSNGGVNTMFPENWDEARIIDEINSAWENRKDLKGRDSNMWQGISKSGVLIRGYKSPRITAYPVYENR